MSEATKVSASPFISWFNHYHVSLISGACLGVALAYCCRTSKCLQSSKSRASEENFSLDKLYALLHSSMQSLWTDHRELEKVCGVDSLGPF